MNTTISEKYKYAFGASTTISFWSHPKPLRFNVPADFFLESSSEETEYCNDATAILINESINALARSKARKSYKTVEEFLQRLSEL